MPHKTPAFDALYRKVRILGVQSRLFAAETAAIGIIVFALAKPMLLAFVALTHAAVMALNYAEPEWTSILPFLLALPKETNAKLP